MCQDHAESTASQDAQQPKEEAANSPNDRGDPFPWEVGVFDAHCHPTDTMASIPSIHKMGARALTVMSTRLQDQDLVFALASDLGVRSPAAQSFSSAAERVIPAFGWHPWFSYGLYDDSLPPAEATYDSTAAGEEARRAQKARHYAAVLTPAPGADDDGTAFVTALPEPRALSEFVSETRARLAAHGHALIGEVGLDRAFRLPAAWRAGEEAALRAREDPTQRITPGGREGRRLSPHQVRPAHQIAVMSAQLRLAGEMGRAASVHGVQAHGMLFDALAALWRGYEREVVSRRQRKSVAPGAEDFSEEEEEDDRDGEVGEGDDGERGIGARKPAKSKPKPKPKPYPPRICLHSFSGSVQILKQYLNPAIPARIFFSFSVAINLSTAGGESKFPEVLRACPDDRILVESDLHTAGEAMDGYLEEMYRRVCEIKGWGLREGVERIRKNYEEFIFG